METYVRLMVLRQRYRWGYRTLVAEVSDSIQLRRFCWVSLSERLPDESTVRKLTRRIGAETVAELTHALISAATREKRFRARAVRVDSTVVEADVRYPTDSGLAAHGVRALAREGHKLARKIGEKGKRVRDRSRALGRRVRAITRTIRRRSGGAKAELLRLTAATGELLERSVKKAVSWRGWRAGRRAAGALGRSSRPRPGSSSRRPLRQGRPPDQAARQGRADHRSHRLARRPGRPPDPQRQARQAKRVRLRGPVGRADREHQAWRARTDPAATAPGNPAENALLPETVAEPARLGISPRDVAVDGAFMPGPTNEALGELSPERVFISGRQEPGSKRTRRRLQRYRTAQSTASATSSAATARAAAA